MPYANKYDFDNIEDYIDASKKQNEEDDDSDDYIDPFHQDFDDIDYEEVTEEE